MSPHPPPSPPPQNQNLFRENGNIQRLASCLSSKDPQSPEHAAAAAYVASVAAVLLQPAGELWAVRDAAMRLPLFLPCVFARMHLIRSCTLTRRLAPPLPLPRRVRQLIQAVPGSSCRCPPLTVPLCAAALQWSDTFAGLQRTSRLSCSMRCRWLISPCKRSKKRRKCARPSWLLVVLLLLLMVMMMALENRS